MKDVKSKLVKAPAAKATPKTTTTKKQPVSAKVDVKELLKAGAHFGHKPSHWHPQMEAYIYGLRGGIYIIDLFKTAQGLESAMKFVRKNAADGKQILFVGTKRHIRNTIQEAATACDMPYVTERWLGGTLTNFATIHQRVKYLKDTEAKFESGELAETYNKRELGEIKEEMAKLNLGFGGVKGMDELPAAVFVADVVTDKIAVREANRLGIPVVAIVDTNGDPTTITEVIPANDDAVSTVSLISNLIAGAIRQAEHTKKPVPVETRAQPVKAQAGTKK